MTSRVEQVLDELGRVICDGELSAGTILTAEAIQQRTATSRSAVREALSRLVALGLLRPRRRLGYEVQDASVHRLLAPEVVRWTLATGHGDAAFDELEQLRRLIEPTAARQAAKEASDELRAQIAADAGTIWAAASRGDREQFVAADSAMHQAVYASTGNRYFAALGAMMAELLPTRADPGKPISLAEARAHLDLADAIMQGDEDAAERTARAIASAPLH